MQSLCEALWQWPEARECLSRVQKGDTPVAMGGLSSVHKAHIIAAIRRKTNRPCCVLCADETEAARIAADCALFAEEESLILRSRDFSFYAVEAVSREWEHSRLSVLHRLQTKTAPIIVGTVNAFLQRSLPPGTLGEQSVVLKEGAALDLTATEALLVGGGYKRCDQVEGVGQFAVRGGILDVYSPAHPSPVRIELFGDEIDTIHAMETTTQRRGDRMFRCVLLPAAETLAHTAKGGLDGLTAELRRRGFDKDAERLETFGSLASIDKYAALINPDLYTAMDYLPRDTIVFAAEQVRMGERINNTLWQAAQDTEHLLTGQMLTGDLCSFYCDAVSLWKDIEAHDCVFLDLFLASSYPLRPHMICNLTCKQLPSFGASLETAVHDVKHYQNGGYATVVLVPTGRRAAHLDELLRENGQKTALGGVGLPPPGGVAIRVGALSSGLEYPAFKVAVLTEGQQAAPRRRTARTSDKNRKRLQSYTDLTPGDLVVHEHHGIGRFAGITAMSVDGLSRDYIKLCYAGTDSLYVPVTQLHLVSKYIGAGDGEGGRRLNKLGGVEWAKSRMKAKAAAKDLAKGMILLYAERERREGFAFPKDDAWQMGFEESFEYEETEDQLRCAKDIKQDMEKSRPMDRLLCGDVGFGKTEVALRAVMKCVLGGKQAALLVPTTILAQQHYQTALRRFAGYPINVEVLSRFRTPAHCAQTIKKLALGKVDFVIGTHKLLQKSVRFRNLGLLVVDEEQRFGVTHKERLKEMSRQVDVLTLTATPIPRTLNMALSGIRDLSTIEEAPRDRMPVQTFVLEHDWGLLTDAIRREIARGGQVYYLHNRVESIDRVASRLLSSLPEVSVAVAHGQMQERDLSNIMQQVVNGEVQILCCTTIIETGLDIPNVNTLIVEDADRLGLAQLHQIRGRVGRSSRHAYAYLTYKRGKVLQEDAAKRLSAIREFAEFGSGIKIAMRDMEIRGAGNILGAEQHGHMMNVGYDMYLRLLEEAVLEEKGGKVAASVDCVADLPVNAGIPEAYIGHAGIRMDFYRRIAALSDKTEAGDLIDEMIDRFGDLPESVHTLVRIALLRADASMEGIFDISLKKDRLQLKIQNPEFIRIAEICGKKQYKGRIIFNAGNDPYLSVKLRGGDDVLTAAGDIVKDYAGTRQLTVDS